MNPEISLIPAKEPVENNKRMRLTPKEVAELALKQNGYCACGCDQKLIPGQIEQEHTIPISLGGQSKPDALWLRDCHKNKTAKDRKNIAKVDRLTGKTGKRKPGAKTAKIPGRGFGKRFRKKLNGETVARER